MRVEEASLRIIIQGDKFRESSENFSEEVSGEGNVYEILVKEYMQLHTSW